MCTGSLQFDWHFRTFTQGVTRKGERLAIDSTSNGAARTRLRAGWPRALANSRPSFHRAIVTVQRMHRIDQATLAEAVEHWLAAHGEQQPCRSHRRESSRFARRMVRLHKHAWLAQPHWVLFPRGESNAKQTGKHKQNCDFDRNERKMAGWPVNVRQTNRVPTSGRLNI